MPAGTPPAFAVIRDREYGARESERIAARDSRSRRAKLVEQRRCLWTRHIDDAQATFGSFVRQIQDSSPVRPHVQREPLATVAAAVQIVVAYELHVARICTAL